MLPQQSAFFAQLEITNILPAPYICQCKYIEGNWIVCLTNFLIYIRRDVDISYIQSACLIVLVSQNVFVMCCKLKYKHQCDLVVLNPMNDEHSLTKKDTTALLERRQNILYFTVLSGKYYWFHGTNFYNFHFFFSNRRFSQAVFTFPTPEINVNYNLKV